MPINQKSFNSGFSRVYSYSLSKKIFYSLLPIMFTVVLVAFSFSALPRLDSYLFYVLFGAMLVFGLSACFLRIFYVWREIKYNSDSLFIFGPGFKRIFHWKDLSEIVLTSSYSGKKKLFNSNQRKPCVLHSFKHL